MSLINEAILRVMVDLNGLQDRLSDEEGQTLAEYGLIMAVIAVAVVVAAVVVFRDALTTAFDTATACLTGASGSGC